MTDLPDEVNEMMGLYQQTTKRRPSVEYIPMPYGPPQRDAGRPAPRNAK